MQSKMKMIKNQRRLEEELIECDRRIAFLEQLKDAEDNNDCDWMGNGWRLWTDDRLTLTKARSRIIHLTSLYQREEKLMDGFARFGCAERADECRARMGLLKECVDRYTSLLPESSLDCFGSSLSNSSTTHDQDSNTVRRSRGANFNLYLKVDSIQVDRFDDEPVDIQIFCDNALVPWTTDDSNLLTNNYNSNVGCRVELYVYTRKEHGMRTAAAMAAFHVVSSIDIGPILIHLEPRGSATVSIQFEPKKTLRRGAAIRRLVDYTNKIDTKKSNPMRHRLEIKKSMLQPVKCAHCHELMFRWLQCQDCGFVCHERCAPDVVVPCLPNSHQAAPKAVASFALPHSFCQDSNQFTVKWCCHCGRMGWAGRGLQCGECKDWCHVKCQPYVPDHCGLSVKLKRALPLTCSLDSCRPSGLDAKFELVKTIGRGSFGKVFLARHGSKLVAVKSIKKSDIVKHHELDNVLTEYRILELARRYADPFMIKLVQVSQTRERVFFVTEYVSGGDLMFHCQRCKLTLMEVKFLAAQIVLGLSFLHKHGVIYRDLKLDNVLLTEDGYTKLADFGLSKDNQHGDLATTRTFCGTPEYMAPEIIKELPYDRSIDWWAFGVCLYELVYYEVRVCVHAVYSSHLHRRRSRVIMNRIFMTPFWTTSWSFRVNRL